MCEPVLIGSALMALAGGAVQHNAQKKALQRQDAAIAQADQIQQGFQQKKQDQVTENARPYEPQAQQQQLQGVIDTSQQRLQGVAQDAAQTVGGYGGQGASPDYERKAQDRAAFELQKAIGDAGLVARAGSGQKLMFEQGLQSAQGASKVDDISSLMTEAARHSQNEINRAGRVNNGQMLLGGVLQTAGSAMGGMAGRGGVIPNRTAAAYPSGILG